MNRASVNDRPRALTPWYTPASTFVAALVMACASGSGATPVVSTFGPSNLSRLDSAMPERVDAFVLRDRRRLPGVSDMSYRYRDGSSANVSVYVYPMNYPGSEGSGGARERVAHEGQLFLEVLPIQVKRGVYDSFEPLVSRPDSFVVGGLTVPGYLTGARVRRGASAAHELQFLHLVGGDYVKLRATVPESWPIATLRSLDSGIVARLVHP